MKKPTGILTNIPELGYFLEKRCLGNHEHGVLVTGTKTRKSQQYTPQFVDAILRGIREALAKPSEVFLSEKKVIPC